MVFKGNPKRHALNSKGVSNQKSFASTEMRNIKLVGCNSHINKNGKSDLGCAIDTGDKKTSFKRIDHLVLNGDLKCDLVKGKQDVMVCSPLTPKRKRKATSPPKPKPRKRKVSKKRKTTKRKVSKKRNMRKQKIKTKSGDSFIIWYPENAKFGQFGHSQKAFASVSSAEAYSSFRKDYDFNTTEELQEMLKPYYFEKTPFADERRRAVVDILKERNAYVSSKHKVKKTGSYSVGNNVKMKGKYGGKIGEIVSKKKMMGEVNYLVKLPSGKEIYVDRDMLEGKVVPKAYASVSPRQTWEDKKIVKIPKDENVYLGRDVRDTGVEGYSNVSEITNTLAHIERDYIKGAIDKRILNARLSTLALSVKRSNNGILKTKTQKRTAIRRINRVRDVHNLKKLPIKSYVK